MKLQAGEQLHKKDDSLMPWDHDRWRHCINLSYNYGTFEIGRMLAYSARRKNAISFSFVNPYQTSSTENVWNCLFRMNIWKLSSSLRKSCSVFIFSWNTILLYIA